MELLLFLLGVFVISISGAMMPGPVMATAIAIGVRKRYAGLALAVGHGIVEFPLIFLIMLGLDKLLKSTRAQMIIGLVGGILLVGMAIQMVISLKNSEDAESTAFKDSPILAGMILSVSNPYFILWWATIGLALANEARGFGIWAFVLFAFVHWFCDCVCLGALAWTSFKGTKWLGTRGRRIVMLVCSGAVALFGLLFIYKSASTLLNIVSSAK
ncbi:MAG: LysE family transporter [Planctomycetota bacterium]